MSRSAVTATRRVGLLVAITGVLACPAGDARADGGPPAPRPPDKPAPSVLGKLPAEFAVYAVGTYRGTADLSGIQLDKSGHTVSRADVVVNLPGKPVVLVLTAYDPTVWQVGRTPKTTIAGVLVSGYHGQALTGVDKGTPHAVSTYEAKGDFGYFFAYRASPRLLAMNDSVKALVGREIDRFVTKPTDGVFYVGDRPAEGAEVIRSDDLAVKSVAGAGEQVAGPKALDQLVADGKLRVAAQADIDAWVDKASEPYARFGPDLRVGHLMRVDRTYVVLKECTLPNGLHGAHSRAFIVPDGVPFPKGPVGHNQFYLMDGTTRNVHSGD